jgi:hypothetical protein
MPDEFPTQTPTMGAATPIRSDFATTRGLESGIKDQLADWISQLVQENRSLEEQLSLFKDYVRSQAHNNQELAIQCVKSAAELFSQLWTEESAETFNEAHDAILRISSRPSRLRINGTTMEDFNKDVKTVQTFCRNRDESWLAPFKDKAKRFFDDAVELYSNFVNGKEGLPLSTQ